MTKGRTFHQTAAPQPRRKLGAVDMFVEWQRLSHELLEDPAAALPLDVRKVVYSNAEVIGRMEEENKARASFCSRVEGMIGEFDLEACGAEMQGMLESLAGKRRKRKPGGEAAIEKANRIVEQMVDFLADESERRKKFDKDLKNFVANSYDGWLKNGMPVEKDVAVRRPLRFKAPALSNSSFGKF